MSWFGTTISWDMKMTVFPSSCIRCLHVFYVTEPTRQKLGEDVRKMCWRKTCKIETKLSYPEISSAWMWCWEHLHSFNILFPLDFTSQSKWKIQSVPGNLSLSYHKIHSNWLCNYSIILSLELSIYWSVLAGEVSMCTWRTNCPFTLGRCSASFFLLSYRTCT